MKGKDPTYNHVFDKPVFIIGAARSGTTLLGEILDAHPALSYWLEPKYIWRYGNAKAPNDYRPEEEAKPEIISYIRKRFNNFLHKKGGERLLEKTPSSCFRVSFINKVFPEALFINIQRDGREVVLSAEKKWTSTPDRSALYRRLTSNEIPISELPSYGMATLRDVVGRQLFPDKGFVWGPHFPGMQDYRNKHNVTETCAMQWVESVKHISTALDKIDQSRYIKVDYKDILTNTSKTLDKILYFLGLENVGVKEYAQKNIIPKTEKAFTEKEQSKLDSIMPIIKEQLLELEYE